MRRFRWLIFDISPLFRLISQLAAATPLIFLHWLLILHAYLLPYA
jgi:hypothetical protein